MLYEHIKDKSKVLTGKRVTNVEQTSTGVSVTCKDGSSYQGHIVVGADGIRSTVRQCMQDHIETLSPGATEKDRNSISAEYNCIFGIGNPVEAPTTPGESHRSYDKNHSTLSFVGGGGILYWFLFSKLDKRYWGKEIPRYTTEQMEEAAHAFDNIHMTDKITFKEVFEQRTYANFLAIEESQNEHWSSGRMVCIGDAVHKMTPNLGAGGNAAIESATALANHIFKLTSTNPSTEELDKVFKAFHKKRENRANSTCDTANDLTRIEALDNWVYKILALKVIPAAGDFLTDLTTDALVGAEILESLPPPARSLAATMPWDPEAGIGKKEKKWVRALYALPLLAIVYGCHLTMGQTMKNFELLPAPPGMLNLGNGVITSLVPKFFGIAAVDKIMSKFVALFTPAIGGLDVGARMQAIAFLGDLIPIQTIWMIESIRRGNAISTAAFL